MCLHHFYSNHWGIWAVFPQPHWSGTSCDLCYKFTLYLKSPLTTATFQNAQCKTVADFIETSSIYISGLAVTAVFGFCFFLLLFFSALTCTLTDAPPHTCAFICTLTVSSGRIFLRLCHVMLCAASCDNKHALFQVWPLTSCLLLQVGVKMVFALAACALVSLSPLLVLGVPPIRTQPEQVHLSYPGKCFNCHHKLQI